MEELPAGTVTFLFTDVERSTEMVQRLGDAAYGDLLKTHRALLRTAFTTHHGREVDTQGDAFFVVFADARDAVRAALAIQDALATHPWPSGAQIRVRTGLHSGTAVIVGNAYVGVDVHRAHRICAVGHGGQVVLSQVTSLLVADALPAGVRLQDLGEHRLRDLRRPERIFQVVHPHLPPALPPLRSLSVLPHNLPVQLTSFIGRDREISEVKHLLANTRLLTLTGPGGSGKTRLALQAAAESLHAYPDGVWLAELAALADPDLVRSAVAAALDVREETGRPLQTTLVDALQNKRLLLILDNCEHLVEACAQTAESLLRAVPDLTILATSRERLGAAGETSYLVPPMSVPDVRRPQAPEDLVKIEAVRLFIERAASIQPGFSLTPAAAADVARIVHTLDGIPLAIELAAARVRVLSVPQIAQRLQDRFHLLTAGGRTAAPRQQTLQATMDWSYDLLSEPERALLRRLSVFASGATLDAVEAVCVGGEVGLRDTVDLLSRLVDKSLVVAEETNGARRYWLLDTVSAYAREKLSAAGETPAFRRHHAGWYQRLVEQAEPHLETPDRRWMDRLETEHDNIRAALDATITPGGGEDALRFAVALHRFWHIRGYWTEGRRWLEAALAANPHASPGLRAKALARIAAFAQHQGDYRRAQALAEEGLGLYQALGDPRGMADVLNTLGNIAYHQGDYDAARKLHEASLARGRDAGDKYGIASSLVNLAIVADHLGQYEQAVAWCRDSLTIFREIGDPRGTAFALSVLGTLASDQGDYTTARPLFEESLALQRTLGDRHGMAGTLVSLGRVLLAQRNFSASRTALGESLTLRRELGSRHGIAASLWAQGHLARLEHRRDDALARMRESLELRRSLGDKTGIAECLEELAHWSVTPGRAVVLMGAAEALRRTTGARRSPPADRAFAELLASIRASAGDKMFDAEWHRGQTLGPEAAAMLALSDEAAG